MLYLHIYRSESETKKAQWYAYTTVQVQHDDCW